MYIITPTSEAPVFIQYTALLLAVMVISLVVLRPWTLESYLYIIPPAKSAWHTFIVLFVYIMRTASNLTHSRVSFRCRVDLRQNM